MQIDSSKFVNLQGDRSAATQLFLSRSRIQLLKSSKPSPLTNSSGNLNLTRSSNFLVIPNSPKSTTSKLTTTAHFFKKLLPLVASHDLQSQSFSSKFNTNNANNTNNAHRPSFSMKNQSESSRKCFSPRKIMTLDLGPHQSFLTEMLSEDFDNNIRNFMENNDQKAFAVLQKDRFIKLKRLSEYMSKEIEGLLGPTPLSTKQSFAVDLLRLIQSDYNKIITNFLGFFELIPVIHSQRGDNQRLNTTKNSLRNSGGPSKPDLLATIHSLLQLLQRLYPAEIRKFDPMPELLDELQSEIDALKTSLRVLDYDERAFGLSGHLEGYIKSLHGIMESQNNEIKSLKTQLAKYEAMHDENYFFHSKGDTENLLQKVLCTDAVSNRKEVIKERMNNLVVFTDRISGLEAKLQTSAEDFAKKDQHIAALENRIQEMIVASQQKPLKISKQTQATGFFPMQTPSISLLEGDRIIAKLLEKSSVGFKMGYDCSLALVNLLLCEKLIQDVQDLRERRQPQTLQRFVFQWFLSRLGNSRLSKLFLTDFFSSVFCEKQSRFRLFIDLVGLDSFEVSQKSTRNPNRGTILHPQKRGSIIATNNNIEEKTSIIPSVPAISIFTRSPQACKLILKACYHLKYGTNNQKSVDRYAPLLPSMDGELGACGFELVLETFKQILKDEDVGEDAMEEYCTELIENVLSNNDVLRKTSSGNMSPNLVDKFKHNLLEKTTVNIDYFLSYLMEFFSIKFKSKLDSIIKGFEVLAVNRPLLECSCSVDDFRTVLKRAFPKKSKAWIENIFASFCMKNLWTPNANLNEMLLNMASEFLQIDGNYIGCSDQRQELAKKPSIDFTAVTTNERPNKSNLSKKKKPPVELVENALSRLNSAVSLKSKREIENGGDQFRLENFDIVNDITVLTEFYKLIQGIILKEEAKNESLFINHQVFKKELMKLPSMKLFSSAKLYAPLFAEHERRDLIEKVEKTWYYFRLLFEVLSPESGEDKK